ncbi:hypothetical protein [Flavobacterium sp. 245]|uniref:hypothetical protein n=1 Tax=Flavobacterium sp. 245 TaxID=2512115 RepID=UPI00105CD8E9|nr:hypothetical protein [Flavobacterium sp. 245]TDP02421.1 hypothetical protein EV145_103411 [Flavobacterium sp. 245]
MIRPLLICFVLFFFTSSFIWEGTDLVKSNTWFIAGPVAENQEIINAVREKEGIIRVTAKDFPVGEIELNVTIIPSETNEGIPKNLSENSGFVTIIYKSTQLIKLQAREGNTEGTGCIHGGSHPMVDLPASPKHFTTLQIPWKNFKQDGLADGKLLNIHNLCKFNFVNYKPVSGALLEIKSVIIQN